MCIRDRSITFTVENTAEIQKQEMKDDVTKVLISKQDIAGKELSGAKLTILDEEGNVIESWTSTEEAHYIGAAWRTGHCPVHHRTDRKSVV